MRRPGSIQRCTLDEAQALLVPFPADLLTLYEVSPKVNSPVYNTPDALHPVAHVARASSPVTIGTERLPRAIRCYREPSPTALRGPV